MMSLNRVCLSGNLTRDPELRSTAGGASVATMRVAVNDREKDAAGAWVDRPSFVDVTVWGATAESCYTYLAKGRPVLVDGRLRLEEWQAKDGSSRQALKVVAERVVFLPKGDATSTPPAPRQEAGQAAPAPPAAVAPARDPDTDDDIPF